jgi:trimethylamine--corrinoid protein Co-methyltransferase
VEPHDDLPTTDLIRALMADQHLIMADHTMRHWPEELYLPSAIVDRDNRENWTRLGAKDAYERARDEVDRRLAAYHQLETDPAIDDELRRIIRSGLVDQDTLPEIPVAPEPVAVAAGVGERRHNRRREAARPVSQEETAP